MKIKIIILALLFSISLSAKDFAKPDSVKLNAGTLNPAIQREIKQIFPNIGNTASYAVTYQINPDYEKEEFKLEITPEAIDLTAGSNAGILYGTYTLKGLFSRDSITPVSIHEKPACKYRGLYMNFRSASPSRFNELKRLVRTLSELRINLIFAEFADNVQYKSCNFGRKGFTPEQLKELSAYSKNYNVEIIPYFQALSHTVWILSLPNSKNILENPNVTNWHTAWCPTNPEIKRIFRNIIKESIEIFSPSMMHLSLDEVSHGPYRHCSRCKQYAPEKLFKNVISDYHELLKTHGIKLVIWHDELVPPEMAGNRKSKTDGWKILDQLPKDIIINVWNYKDSLAQQKLFYNYFCDRGFKVMGASFNNSLEGFRNIAKTYANSLGFVNTFWYEAGDWSVGEIANKSAKAVTSTAVFGWNPYILDKLYPKNPVGLFYRKCFSLDSLPGKLQRTKVIFPKNVKLGTTPYDWPGVRAGKEAPPVIKAVGQDRFKAVFDKYLWVDGNIFQAPEIKLKGKVSYISFVHASSIPADHIILNQMFNKYNWENIGKYIITYRNGKSADINLIYRKNILDWNSDIGALLSAQNYLGTSQSGKRWMWGTLLWKNPHPEWEIVSIRLKAKNKKLNSIACQEIALWNNGGNIDFETAGTHKIDKKKMIFTQEDEIFESFDYSETDEFWKRWKINASGLTGKIEITFKKDSAGNGNLILTVPPARKNTLGRITLDCPMTITSEAQWKRAFSFVMENSEQLQLGLYTGNDDWSLYRSSHNSYKGKNIIVFSPASLSEYETDKKSSWKDMKQLRLSFFLRNSKAFKIKISPIHHGDFGAVRSYNRGRKNYEIEQKK